MGRYGITPRSPESEFLPNGSIVDFRVDSRFDFNPIRGRGPYIFSKNGKGYIDYILGAGALLLGHCNAGVVRAVVSQVRKGSTFYYTTDSAIELAKMISEASPCAEKLTFTNSGTEATMLAMRLARAYVGKEKIVKFQGSYHGWHDYSEVESPGVPEGAARTVLECPYGDIQALRSILSQNKDDVAAVMIEPIQRSIIPDKEFIQEIRELTEARGIVLIFDEIATGFRIRYGGAQQFFAVKADLATYGKVIGGGYPLAAVAGRRDLFEIYSREKRTKMPQFGTLIGNPLSCVAGISTLKQLKRQGVYEKLDEYGIKLARGIREVLNRAGVSVQTSQAPGFVDYNFLDRPIKDVATLMKANRELKNRYASDLMGKGIYSPHARILGKMYYSVTHGRVELNHTLRAFEDLTKSYKAAGEL